MKKFYLLALMISLTIINSNAQSFFDDMESYTEGEPISVGHWTDWNCGGGEGCAIISNSDIVLEGNLSGLITSDGTTNAVLNLYNKIFGDWCLVFYMYVPSDKEATFNLQGTVPVVDGESIVGNFYFNENNNNPNVGHIDDTTLGDVVFNFPHDKWFKIFMYWDISWGIQLATWFVYIDGVEIIPYETPFTNQAGTVPTSVGGVNFFSKNAETSLYYLDYFALSEDSEHFPCFFGLGQDDNKSLGLEIYPNPVSDALYLQSEQEITSISISNILGQEIYSSKIEALSYRIDVSNFSSGTYFMKVTVGNDTIIKKIIKE